MPAVTKRPLLAEIDDWLVDELNVLIFYNESSKDVVLYWGNGYSYFWFWFIEDLTVYFGALLKETKTCI